MVADDRSTLAVKPSCASDDQSIHPRPLSTSERPGGAVNRVVLSMGWRRPCDLCDLPSAGATRARCGDPPVSAVWVGGHVLLPRPAGVGRLARREGSRSCASTFPAAATAPAAHATRERVRAWTERASALRRDGFEHDRRATDRPRSASAWAERSPTGRSLRARRSTISCCGGCPRAAQRTCASCGRSPTWRARAAGRR